MCGAAAVAGALTDGRRAPGRWGLIAQAKTLINECGVDVNLAENEANETALHCAMNTLLRAEMNDVVALLLAKGADINKRDRDGNTPLMRALAALIPQSMSCFALILGARRSCAPRNTKRHEAPIAHRSRP